jgi:hypothetical protein
MLVGLCEHGSISGNGEANEKEQEKCAYSTEITNVYPFCAKIFTQRNGEKEMKKTNKALFCLLTLSLLAVVLVSCGGGVPKEGLWENATYTTDKEFGSGAKTVQVEVKAGEQSVTFTVKTDKENLADALLEHGLVSGDDSAFGLYIKYVNGMRADYDKDQAYWGLTKNGETMLDGASSITELDGAHYEFTYTK